MLTKFEGIKIKNNKIEITFNGDQVKNLEKIAEKLNSNVLSVIDQALDEIIENYSDLWFKKNE